MQPDETPRAEVERELPINALARRQLIKSALASVPIVLTITAGKARAQGESVVDSTIISDNAGDGGGGDEEELLGAGDGGDENLESDPYGAEKMETWGLESTGEPPTAESLRGM